MLKANTLTPEELVPILLREARRRLPTLAIIFAAIALLALAAGLLFPKNYASSTTILAQQSDIIQPLLEGRAVATEVADRAGMARQVIFSRKVMDDVLETGGWTAEPLTPVQRDRLLEDVQSRIVITSPRESLVHITYRDSDPERSYEVTKRLGDLFIEESLTTKERESREAYEFIDSQVQEYHRKLLEAERNLQDYRSANADAQPGSAADATSRIGALRTQVEQTRMTLLELRSREQALASQLSGESAVTAVQTRESLYRSQLLDLQSQLDTALLSYTDQHPDVVRIRHQMADIQRAMQQAQQRREQGGGGQAGNPFEDSQLNPQYQELRSRLNEARREIAAAQSRLQISESMLHDELDRSRRIAASEGALQELTRDQEVNRDVYQDLLRRRENARVSMELDREKRGLTMRVQDPAVMPLRPTGLRLVHFALAGLLLAIALPLGLLFAVVRLDPRIRSPHQLQRHVAHPLLTVVPTYLRAQDKRRRFIRTASSLAIVAGVFVVYALTYVFRALAA